MLPVENVLARFCASSLTLLILLASPALVSWIFPACDCQFQNVMAQFLKIVCATRLR